MRQRISLSAQVLILLTVPLVFQLGLLASLANLQREAEIEAQKAVRAQRLSEAINGLSKDIFEGISGFNDTKDALEADTPHKYMEISRRLRSDFDNLGALTKDNPHQAEVVRRARSAGENVISQVISAEFFVNNGGELGRDERKKFWKKMREYIHVIISDDLLDIGRSEAEIFNRNPEKQTAFRQKVQQLLLLGGAVNVALAVALALYLTRSITGRLKILSDNSYRLASQRPLNPVLRGSDEIARVDQAFHKMADELQEAYRKQGAIIDNAEDVICSLDKNGTFIAINPACEEILGYGSDELEGQHFIQLVAEENREMALDFMKQLRAGEDLKPHEIALIRRNTCDKGTSPIDALWSAHWSEQEETFFCVIHDITDRRQAERMKQEVVSMVTHDLRTPITTIQNFLDFLNDGFYGSVNEKGARYLYLAQRNAERMITLINDLLDIEKIKSGMMKLETSHISLASIFNLCRDLNTSWAEQTGVILDIQNTPLFIEADEDRLVRVLSNLVSNAIKFSPRGGIIRVWAEENNGTATIYVQDQGPGIPANMLETVFDRFQQVRGQGPKTKGGSGLGLAICKAIVQLHGGKIWLESKEGHGSRFIFTLPNAVITEAQARGTVKLN